VAKFQLAQVKSTVRYVWDLQARERKFLLGEIVQVKGLMPLLMKPRNKQRWSAEDKAELRDHLRRLSHISPYIAVMILPGSFLMLPLLAWWLDRRRKGAPEQRAKFEAKPATPATAGAAPAIAGPPQAPVRTD
jgi:hypothetical protein